jgi:hypothetical protein
MVLEHAPHKDLLNLAEKFYDHNYEQFGLPEDLARLLFAQLI